MTLAQWAQLDEEVTGELIDGRLEEEEMPTLLHELVVGWLVATFHTWLADRGGVVGGSEAKLAVGSTRGRKPDVFVYLPGRPRPPLDATLFEVPPTIVVEVVTPTPRDVRRDRIEKLGDYAAFGVRYYWVIDPELRTLEIWELDDKGRYFRALAAFDGTLTEIPGCAGLSIDLSALWTRIDQLATE
jgi:Uma2 family endonuclease